MLTIQTNLQSLFAQRSWGRTEGSLQKSMRRFSSGLRINSAADDAAGLSISNRMSSRIRGLGQAARNINDGISLLQTTDGALIEVTELLQRGRELAVQSANGTLSAADRTSIQKEFLQIVGEIDRIAGDTRYNGIEVLQQGGGSATEQQEVLDGLKSGWLAQAESIIQSGYGILGSGVDLTVDLSSSDGAGGTLAFVRYYTGGPGGTGQNLELHVDMADFTPITDSNGGTAPFYNDRILAHELVHAVFASRMNVSAAGAIPTWFNEGSAEFIHGADERLAADLAILGGAAAGANALINEFNNGWGGTSADYSAAYAAVRYMHQRIKTAGGNGLQDITGWLAANPGSTLDQALATASAGAFTGEADFKAGFNATGSAFIQGMNLANADTGAIAGADADGGAIKTAESVVPNGGAYSEQPLAGFNVIWPAITSGIGLQLGPEAGNYLELNLGSISSGALGINGLDLSSDGGGAIAALDAALKTVDGQRAGIGATANRLESAVAVTQTEKENLAEGRQRILDADFGQETARLARQNLIKQAAVSLMAQANLNARLALELIAA